MEGMVVSWTGILPRRSTAISWMASEWTLVEMLEINRYGWMFACEYRTTTIQLLARCCCCSCTTVNLYHWYHQSLFSSSCVHVLHSHYNVKLLIVLGYPSNNTFDWTYLQICFLSNPVDVSASCITRTSSPFTHLFSCCQDECACARRCRAISRGTGRDLSRRKWQLPSTEESCLNIFWDEFHLITVAEGFVACFGSAGCLESIRQDVRR